MRDTAIGLVVLGVLGLIVAAAGTWPFAAEALKWAAVALVLLCFANLCGKAVDVWLWHWRRRRP